jgi:hypothetical protein
MPTKNLKHYHSLEERVLALKQAAQGTTLSMGDILSILSGKGRMLILILLSLPFCQPLQIPGLSIPFGLIIAFIGLRIAFGKHLWLPKRILSKTIQSSTLNKIIDKSLWLIKKMKRWTHPRLTWMITHPVLQVVHGLIFCALGLCLALPLPIPFTNLASAWSIFIIALGLIEDDGLFILIGYLMALLTLLFLIFIGMSMEHFVVQHV